MTYTPTRRQTHCAFCGTRFADRDDWPRDCPGCGETTWRNPTPVGVALLPVRDTDGTVALVVARRTIQPALGALSLPGGYLELGETWQQGVVRELHEETGIVADADQVELFDVDNGSATIQVFGLLPLRDLAELPPSVATAETEGWLLLDRPRRLAFPTQTAAVAKYFAMRSG